jgi:hypothetical protein
MYIKGTAVTVDDDDYAMRKIFKFHSAQMKILKSACPRVQDECIKKYFSL